MLILELFLTIIVWFRGWKWKALAPLGGVTVVSLIIGFTLGLSGGNLESVAPLMIAMDFTATGALLGMCFIRPKT